MIKIYHNPRCAKSREGLALLEQSGKEFEVVHYLENPPTKAELTDILSFLSISPDALIRKNEPIWKEKFKGKELSAEELIIAMTQYPKLIERPIVIKDQKAVIGRPSDEITKLLE